MYRPFCKKNLAYNRKILERPSKWESIFPNSQTKNLVIGLSTAPIKKNFSVLITNVIQNFDFMEHTQSFPLYIYEKAEQDSQMILFNTPEKDKTTYTRRDVITDEALQAFRKVYRQEVTKEDIFIISMRYCRVKAIFPHIRITYLRKCPESRS